jgi:hypothetical protein
MVVKYVFETCFIFQSYWEDQINILLLSQAISRVNVIIPERQLDIVNLLYLMNFLISKSNHAI